MRFDSSFALEKIASAATRRRLSVLQWSPLQSRRGSRTCATTTRCRALRISMLNLSSRPTLERVAVAATHEQLRSILHSGEFDDGITELVRAARLLAVVGRPDCLGRALRSVVRRYATTLGQGFAHGSQFRRQANRMRVMSAPSSASMTQNATLLATHLRNCSMET